VSYQVDGLCYSDEAAAASAIAARLVGQLVDLGGTPHVVGATVSGASITYTLSPVTGGATVTYTQAADLQPCGLIEWEDASMLAWGIATAWIATAAVMFLRGAR
jgi:hypothetical protein